MATKTVEKPKLIEFKNCTSSENMWVEKGNTPFREGRAVLVKPGKSVWLTEEDVRLQKEERQDPRFVDGRLRQAGKAGTLVVGEIKVRDDMTHTEIEVVVGGLKGSRDLANKINRLSSIATVNDIMEECEKQDKPISYLKTCLRKVNSLSEKKEIEIKNLAREERAKERKATKELKEK